MAYPIPKATVMLTACRRAKCHPLAWLGGGPCMDGPKPTSSGRLLWAEILLRGFEVDAPCCPDCDGRMSALWTKSGKTPLFVDGPVSLDIIEAY